MVKFDKTHVRNVFLTSFQLTFIDYLGEQDKKKQDQMLVGRDEGRELHCTCDKQPKHPLPSLN